MKQKTLGVGRRSGLAHGALVMPAKADDEHLLPDLLHGNEQRVYKPRKLVACHGSKQFSSSAWVPRLCYSRWALARRWLL
jgi:hypothetical protein